MSYLNSYQKGVIFYQKHKLFYTTVSEISKIAAIAIILMLVILILTTTSWAEPFIVIIGLGIAVIINAGSNLIFGEISFVTNAAGNILQLAVSLDYSVFLIHRFEECRKEERDVKTAMINALCMSTSSILSRLSFRPELKICRGICSYILLPTQGIVH